MHLINDFYVSNKLCINPLLTYLLLRCSTCPWIEHHDGSYGLGKTPERHGTPFELQTLAGQETCLSTWWFSFSNFDASDYTYLVYKKKTLFEIRTHPRVHLQCGCSELCINTTIHDIVHAGATYTWRWTLSVTIGSWFYCTEDAYKMTCDTMYGNNHYYFHHVLHSWGSLDLNDKKDSSDIT